MAVEQEDSGIYYPIGDAIPIQLVIVPKLSKEHNYWLNNLRNDLKAGSEIKKITESGLKSIDNTTITHSCVGDFTYNPKTGAVSKMKGGGHGQANIEFLETNGLEYNISRCYVATIKYKEKFPDLDITKDIDLAEEYISGSITQPESI